MEKIFLAALMFSPVLVIAQQRESEKAGLPSERLYVLDGKIVKTSELLRDSVQRVITVKSVDPTDIESIQVLKGVSAVEKYGEAGKNGAVVLTTKSYLQKPKKQ